MKTSIKTSGEAVVAAVIASAVLKNPPQVDIAAGIGGPGAVTLLACAPSVQYAEEKYYHLKVALRH